MKRTFILFSFVLAALSLVAQAKKNQSSTNYFPPAGEWQHRSPAALGLDSTRLQDAIRFANEHETKKPINQQKAQAEDYGKEPYDDPIGPFADRGGPTGANLIYVDPDHDLVAVIRWLDSASMNDMVKQILAALPQ